MTVLSGDEPPEDSDKDSPLHFVSYHPFEVIHLDHIGPLRPDTHGNMFILVLIDAFSRWVELFPTKTTSAIESASCIFQHMGRFGTPEVLHTDRGTAFHNELVAELLRMTGTEQSLATAYSSEENGIVERANQEVLRHLNAILFDSRIHDKWSYEQLPMVQRIMNTVEKTSTGVTPAALILNNSIRLTERILLPPTQDGRLDSAAVHPNQRCPGEATTNGFPCASRIRPDHHRVPGPFLRPLHPPCWQK